MFANTITTANLLLNIISTTYGNRGYVVHRTKADNADPTLVTEEEALSNSLPDYLLCDGCMAVAAEIASGFWAATRHLTKRSLTDSEILYIIEDVCTINNFRHYGVSAKDRKKLVGPGFGVTENAKSGTEVLAGGRFPDRLAQLCLSLTDLEDGTMNEFEMFAQWVKQGKTARALAKVLCLNPASKMTSTCVDKNNAPIPMGSRYYRGENRKYEIDRNGKLVHPVDPSLKL